MSLPFRRELPGIDTSVLSMDGGCQPVPPSVIGKIP